MFENKTVAVVVPAYNEEGFVGTVLETMPEIVDRVYVIDDCSTDGTWKEIQRVANRLNRPLVADGGVADDDRFVVPIQHDHNRGVGGAIKTGYVRARDDGMGVTAVMGGDGQMEPSELERIVEPVATGRADYAKGNRFLRDDDHEEMPRFRRIGSAALTLLTNIASGYWQIGDPQMGYTAISNETLRTVDIEEMYEFYGYCNDLLIRLSAADRRVVDVPTSARYGDETSHISYTTYIPRVSLMLLRMFLWRLAVKRDTPAQKLRSGLYLGGALLTLVGTLASVFRRSPTVLFVALCGAFGVVLGMVTDVLLDRKRNTPDDR